MATVLLFGAFQDLAGWSEEVIEAPTLGALKAVLAERSPALRERLDAQNTLTIHNRVLVRDDNRALTADDEVAFGPPVSGG